MKKSFLLLLLFLCTATAFCAAVPEYLVTGKAPSRLEKCAEEELQLFWQKIYGKKLTVIPESKSSGKAVIYLGNTAFAQKNKVDITKFGEEEWLLKTVGNSLLITGGRPAGTLYGVYQMLEKLGVEFLSFDETFIPKAAKDFPSLRQYGSKYAAHQTPLCGLGNA